MNYRSLARNTGTAFLAQGVAMALSVIQTLLVPKLLGTTQYGYWQLFIFYSSYVGFGHLGLNDGVYLIKGGQSRNEINKKSVNSQFVFGVGFQLIIALLIVILAIEGQFGSDREFVIICTAIFLTVQNAASFLSYLLQAMNETQKSSYSTIVERIAFLIPLVSLLIVRYSSFRPFIVSYIFSSFIQLFYCAWNCRDFFSSGIEPFVQTAGEAFESIRVGFKLMVANIASQLVLGIARFVIDAVWGIDTFGELSFSLSLTYFFLSFVSQASMVLFPTLRQADYRELKIFFQNVRDAMAFFFPAICMLYFPIVWILEIWLPKYADSFIYFAFLIPICIFDSKMDICCTTFFKVLRDERTLLKVNLATCFVNAAITFIGAYFFNSIFAVIGSAVISIIGRSIWSERYISNYLCVPLDYAITVGETLLCAIFIVVVVYFSDLYAFILYLAAYVVYIFLFYKKAKILISKIRQVLKTIK